MYEDFYTELKSKNDIMNVAYSLGYNGKKSGNCYQGDCPNHGSSNGVCLVIWPKIQGWKCFQFVEQRVTSLIWSCIIKLRSQNSCWDSSR